MSLKTPKIETFFANCVKYKKANNKMLKVFSVILELPCVYFDGERGVFKTTFTPAQLTHILILLQEKYKITIIDKQKGLTPIPKVKKSRMKEILEKNYFQVDVVANYEAIVMHINHYRKPGKFFGLLKSCEEFNVKYKNADLKFRMRHFEELRDP
jgi:hypothetical protein